MVLKELLDLHINILYYIFILNYIIWIQKKFLKGTGQSEKVKEFV